MRLSKPAMFFAILLIGPTSLFTNALPADGDIPEAEYAAYLEEDCPLTADAPAYKADFITPDVCVSLVKPIDPNNPSGPVISGYKSGLAAQQKLDTTKYACRLVYYAETHCLLPVGETEILGPKIGFGPCVNFHFPKIFPVFDAKANSVKLFCNTK